MNFAEFHQLIKICGAKGVGRPIVMRPNRKGSLLRYLGHVWKGSSRQDRAGGSPAMSVMSATALKCNETWSVHRYRDRIGGW